LDKLRVFSGHQICEVLVRHGFEKIKQRNSHIVMQKQVPGDTVTVLVPEQKNVRIGTLMSIIRQSGLQNSEFE